MSTQQVAEIQRHVTAGNFQVTVHAHAEIVAEGLRIDDVVSALCSDRTKIIEDYPSHKRGACCLALGWKADGRPIHVVCTTGRPTLIIITVYEPRLPWWATPEQRSH